MFKWKRSVDESEIYRPEPLVKSCDNGRSIGLPVKSFSVIFRIEMLLWTVAV